LKKGKRKAKPQQKKIFWLKSLLACFLMALVLLTWLGRDKDVAAHLIAESTPLTLNKDDHIAEVIAPLLDTDDTDVIIYEDVLPKPEPVIAKAKISLPHAPRHVLGLIIDDVGYNLNALERLLALPFTVTISVLPDSPHAEEAARMAHQHGKVVMLHMPMQTTNPKYQNNMEKSYLFKGMSQDQFNQVFEDALAKVPYAQGINNHMGSLLTADRQSMQWLMKLCQKHNLFFIDSRTSSTTVGATIAQENHIAWNQRDIFLDHHVDEQSLQHAWDSSLTCMQKSDHCILIAHPHKETLAFLERQNQGFNMQDFVPITDLLKE